MPSGPFFTIGLAILKVYLPMATAISLYTQTLYYASYIRGLFSPTAVADARNSFRAGHCCTPNVLATTFFYFFIFCLYFLSVVFSFDGHQ
jgi:hypothetical protein